jgi:hypothetical protein
MKRADATNGFENAEALEADVVAGESRRYEDAVRDLVCLAGFLAPELHRSTRAATVITRWAEGDATLLVEAETVARREHREEPAEILHRARDLGTA